MIGAPHNIELDLRLLEDMFERTRTLLKRSSTSELRVWPRAKDTPGEDVENRWKARENGGPLEQDFRINLYHILVGDDHPDQILKKCWEWYTAHVDAQIKECFNTNLAPIIAGLDSICPKEGPKWTAQVAVVYKVLTVVAGEIRLRKEISIDGIVDELDSKRLLIRESGDRFPKHEQNAARQMVWQLAGILTMLYDPVKAVNIEELNMHQPVSSLRGRGRHRKRVLSSFNQPISKCEEQFHSLLGQFGELLPDAESMLSSTIPLVRTGDHHLNIAYVSFYGLKNVAKLNIEWVNTMNFHLQLDQRKRILRLYRFPAFCRLLWRDDEECLLQQLFHDRRTSLVASGPTDAAYLGISDYLREIILSYRLIFGIDKSSRRAFETELDPWARNKSHSAPPSSQRLHEVDPLLRILCQLPSPSPNSTSDLSTLLELLDGEETSTLYTFEEFPFLGKRLAELQRFSIAQQPNDWKLLLWVDRRDVKNFWSIWIAWAVLIVGGATIILQFWQLVFQVWSTILAWKTQGPCQACK